MKVGSAARGAPRSAARIYSDVARALDSPVQDDARLVAVLRLVQELVPNGQCVLRCAAGIAVPRMTAWPPLAGDPASLISDALDRLMRLPLQSVVRGAGAGLWSCDTGGLGWPAHLAVPLVSADAVLGILAVWRNMPHAYIDDDLILLTVVATQLAAYLAPLEASRRAEEALANAQAEGDHLRYILDQVPEGIILYNAELQATSMNCAARALLGTDL